ncbi:MAG: MFS transporter, partial [Galactobacter sp.]
MNSIQRRDPTRGWGLVLLGSFSAISPLCTDIYTPSLPDVASELTTTASSVQLTLTTFMAGLALGQLIIGTVSDAVGRRRLLLLGGFATVLATVACAAAPNVTVLILARILQGFAGAAGVVLARAIIADCTQGPRTAKLLGVLQVIVGVAPVVAPLIGSLLAQAFSWRGVFWTVAAIMA